jgi:hypothetical protein
MKKTRIALAALVAAATPAAATIIAWFGDVVKVAPPADVTLGMSENDFILQAFDERQCFQVPGGGLPTDQGVIGAGTWVSSHMVHADPTAGVALLLQGRAQFDHDILGVMSTTALLDGSDALCGNPGTIYPTGSEPNRQLEAGQADAYALFGPRTLGVRMEVPVDSYSDQIRVITRCCPDGMVCGD